MLEGKRQKQIGGMLHQELSNIFQLMGLNMTGGGMVSISAVKITPDLLEARIYLSLFQVNDPQAIMKTIEEKSWEIKKELVPRIKQQLRRIPQLKFFRDDTLDHAFKMDELLKKIKPPEEES